MENLIKKATDNMEKTIVQLGVEQAKIRTGRANASMLDSIKAEAYGSLTPINQLGAISVPEARQLLIKPFDKSVLNSIETAINKSDLGLVPQNDGETIRLNIPQLTEETRKEYAKKSKSVAEEMKVRIRNSRRDFLNDVKKEGFAEDEVKNAETKIQDLTDKYISKIDENTKAKEVEIMTI